jgi:hypothetical protein
MNAAGLVVIASLALVASTSAGAGQRDDVVGRWIGTGPTGYGIVDRYQDGRWAIKSYVRIDAQKPAEVSICWGRWKLKGEVYATILDGATSPDLHRLRGQWTSMKVRRITPQEFAYAAADGAPVRDMRLVDSRPLFEVRINRPKAYKWDAEADTIAGSRKSIPAWVNGHPAVPRI